MNRGNIEELMRKIGVNQFTYSGEWVMISCPLARWTHEKGTDRNPSFGIKAVSGISPAHCFSCGFNGGLLSLIQEYGKYAVSEGLLNEEGMQQLYDFILLMEDEEEIVETDTGGARIVQAVPGELEECLGRYHEYFSERMIDEETANKWSLGYSEDEQRVLFPVYDRLTLVGIIGRTVVGEDPKWKNYPPKFEKSRYLYGEWLKPKNLLTVVVVEGPIDTIWVNMALEDREDMFCVGLMGAEPSDRQMEKLADMANEVVVMLDNDSSGKMGKLKLAGGDIKKKRYKGLNDKMIVSVVEWDDDTNDAGDLSLAEIRDLLERRKYSLQEWLDNAFAGSEIE